MKATKTTTSLLMTVLIFCMAACTAESPTETVTNNLPEVEAAENANETENTTDVEDTQMETTPIILKMNGTEVHATLNNTVLAQEFKNLLPYTVTVSRAADDLCGSVSEQLNNDDSENSQGWKIGEIGWFGGWFTILVDNEQNFAQMAFPIIGKIDDQDIPFVQSLTGRVEIEVRLADAE